MPSAIVTATTQAAGLSCLSNILAQITKSYKEQKPFVFDPVELLRFIVLSLITTPPNFKWQHFLERTFPAYRTDPKPTLPLTRKGIKDDDDEIGGSLPKRRLNIKNTLAKWFIDCITMGALLNTMAFLILMGLLKSQSREQIIHNVRTETIPIIVDSYKVWPIASMINFAFIPVDRRIVFLSTIGVLWGVYMSLVAASLK